jgi:SAM-dependent methyltransferase
VGVDLSEAMLKEAKFNAKRYNSKIKFLKGDPRSSIIGKFDVILCTYNYIGHFSKEELKQILKNFKNNLKTNGFIFFDIFNFKFMLKNFKTGKFIDVARKHNDIIVVRFNKNRLDRKNKIMKIHQTTFIQQGNKLKEYKDRWNLQIYTKEDLEEMLTPDFEIVDTFGSIFGEDLFCPYSDEKECIVIFAKKIIE